MSKQPTVKPVMTGCGGPVWGRLVVSSLGRRRGELHYRHAQHRLLGSDTVWMGTGCILNARAATGCLLYFRTGIFLAPPLALFAVGVTRWVCSLNNIIGITPAPSCVICARDDLAEIRRTMTAAALLLDRWAGHRAIGAKNAAIAGLWLKQRFTARALVKILASVRRHDLLPRLSAARAGKHGF
jgi:hypothetical protein